MKFLLLFYPGLLRDLRLALRFLTRLPVPGPYDPRPTADAMGAFPLAGAVLGALLVALDWLLRLAGLAPPGRAALEVVALVALTGGLHLDGLMDSCDGLFGGYTPERRLEIMRDAHLGSFGVLGGVAVLLLKFGLLLSLPDGTRGAALLLAPVFGRWALVLAAALFPPARPDGLGAAFQSAISPRRVATAALSALALASIAGATGLLALAICSIGIWRLGRSISAALGGLTGDSYGALAELTEVLALLVFALGVSGL